MPNFRSAYRWIPSVYTIQGLSYALVADVSSKNSDKSFNFSNVKIAFYTSLLTAPWLFKFIFAPAMEVIESKRKLTLVMEFLIAGLLLLLALCLQLTDFFTLAYAFFLLLL